MPLDLYERFGNWWFKGRIEIDGVPTGEYHRKSTGISQRMPKAAAYKILNDFQSQEIKRHLVGEEKSLTFEEAVLIYKPKPVEAKALEAILPHLGKRACASITGQDVRDLCETLYPMNAVASWRRHVVTPTRAVINHAADQGKCPPIRVKAFDANDRMRQDRIRGKESGLKKVPGSWAWINAFRSVANPYQAAMAQFMFETGARISQACEITVDDLDLKNFRIMMPEAKGTPSQWVTISMELVVELANLPPRRPRKGVRGKPRPESQGEKVFGYSAKDGVYKAWKTACRRAGIEEIMPHAAGRHGFGTEMLVRQRLDPATVAQGGRWADVSLMLKTYMHAEGTEDKIQAALKAGRKGSARTLRVRGRTNEAKNKA